MTYNRDRDELVNYFARLNSAGHGSYERYEDSLRKIACHKLSATDSIAVINGIRNYIERQSEDHPRITANLLRITRGNLMPWKNQMIQALHPSREDQVRPSGLSRVAGALAWLGIHPGHALVVAMCKRAHHKDVKQTITPVETIQIARALAVFETIMTNDVGCATAKELIASLPHQNCAQEIQNAAVQLSHFFGMSCNGWHVLNERPDCVSREEQVTSNVFQRMASDGIKIMREGMIARIRHRPDFVLEGEDGKRAIVEYDGPTHFAGEDQLNGPTIFMTALLAKLRPDQPVIRLPYLAVRDWRSANGCEAARAFLSKAVAMPAGGHLFSRQQEFVPFTSPAIAG